MKRISMILIAFCGILFMSLVPSINSASAAGLVVQATPNPGVVGQVITFTIIATDEQSMYQYGNCDLLLYFGDGTPAPFLGKLSGPNMSKTVTHQYAKFGTFTAQVIPLTCAPLPPTVKTSVRINPLLQSKPLPGK